MRFATVDLRDALRSFRRDRGYAATVILTLALTIGAATAVFSIVDGVLLKPLAYRDAHQLVALREVWHELLDRVPALPVNERHFEYWREHTTTFESMAQYRTQPANLTGAGEATQITLAPASGSLFQVLRAGAALGRTLAPGDEQPGAAAVVTISDALWRRLFGASADAIGRTIALDGTPYEIVGVLPPGFRLPGEAGTTAAEAFVALRAGRGWLGEHNNQAIGRLRGGVTLEEARTELDLLQAQVSDIATREAGERVTLSGSLIPLAEHIAGRARRGLLLLLAAIVTVLLIACSNLANLSLTRTLARVRESAIRSALGATRSRLVARAVLEQLVLSAAGGAAGLWVASIALGAFVTRAPVDLPRLHEVAIDGRVLAFAGLVTIGVALLVAAVPAWRTAGPDVQSALRATAPAVAGERGALRSHGVLLALQVALSVSLLVVAALFGTSLLRVVTVDKGFVAERVLAIDVALPAARYRDEPVRRAAYDRLLQSVAAIPGVTAVTTTSMLPLRGQGQVNFIVPEGRNWTRTETPSANFRFVAPGYFRALGMPMRRGRAFADGERHADRPAPVVISEATAARLWPGESPLDQRFSRGIANEQGFVVVGVVADARTTSLDRDQPLMVYVPYWWRSGPSMALLVRTAGEGGAMVSDIRRAVRGIDPDIAIGAAHQLQDLVTASVAGRRHQTELLVSFGLVALFIATVGVYGVTAYGISRRRREMNIRVALGAPRARVFRLVVTQAMTPVLAGAAAGVAGALALGGLVASLLFDVRPNDPAVLAAVVATVALVGFGACVLAVRRGLTLSPAAALRED